jgi:hypothetical protein
MRSPRWFRPRWFRPRRVTCCVCGQPWDPASPGVEYRSLDGRWWCKDERPCTTWAVERTPDHALAELKARWSEVIDAAIADLEENGWQL